MSRTVRLLDLDDDLVVLLRDVPNGLVVEAFEDPVEDDRAPRFKRPRSRGGFRQGPPLDDEGEAVVVLRVEGDDWAQVATRWEAVRTAVRAHDDFKLQLEVDDVVTTWFAQRRAIRRLTPVAGEYIEAAHRVYELRFTCQPNPTVTIA
jgi:hypothetical protein